mmetsp:Transcript_27145/g.68881  ORF Transcript_27145/g.68881 Transcript_27145/m.68881 type:complete len:203 (+) Transcript_27145:288-896(+)
MSIGWSSLLCLDIMGRRPCSSRPGQQAAGSHLLQNHELCPPESWTSNPCMHSPRLDGVERTQVKQCHSNAPVLEAYGTRCLFHKVRPPRHQPHSVCWDSTFSLVRDSSNPDGFKKLFQRVGRGHVDPNPKGTPLFLDPLRKQFQVKVEPLPCSRGVPTIPLAQEGIHRLHAVEGVEIGGTVDEEKLCCLVQFFRPKRASGHV